MILTWYRHFQRNGGLNQTLLRQTSRFYYASGIQELKKDFEDTKEAIRIRTLKKNRQHNNQTKKVQKDKQRSTKHTYKTKDRVISVKHSKLKQFHSQKMTLRYDKSDKYIILLTSNSYLKNAFGWQAIWWFPCIVWNIEISPREVPFIFWIVWCNFKCEIMKIRKCWLLPFHSRY